MPATRRPQGVKKRFDVSCRHPFNLDKPRRRPNAHDVERAAVGMLGRCSAALVIARATLPSAADAKLQQRLVKVAADQRCHGRLHPSSDCCCCLAGQKRLTRHFHHFATRLAQSRDRLQAYRVNDRAVRRRSFWRFAGSKRRTHRLEAVLASAQTGRTLRSRRRRWTKLLQWPDYGRSIFPRTRRWLRHVDNLLRRRCQRRAQQRD